MSRRSSEIARQFPLEDSCYRSETPPKSYDHFLPVGPFRMWLAHLMEEQSMTITEVSELIMLNERSIRRIMGTPHRGGRCTGKAQERVSLDTVDWALTKADGRTQLWHLYPELYECETTSSDIEISA